MAHKSTFHCYNCDAEIDIPVLNTKDAVQFIYWQLIEQGKAPSMDEVELVLNLFHRYLSQKYGW